jgi:activator of HSP90 ATPase
MSFCKLTVPVPATAELEGVKSVEGEAQIVMARGKKRFIYDFNVVLDIEITTDDLQGDGEEGKGSLCLTEEILFYRL